MNPLSVNPTQANDMLLAILNAGLVPMLAGSPAIGKSSVMKAIAEKNNLKLIDLRLPQCDPCDLNNI